MNGVSVVALQNNFDKSLLRLICQKKWGVKEIHI